MIGPDAMSEGLGIEFIEQTITADESINQMIEKQLSIIQGVAKAAEKYHGLGDKWARNVELKTLRENMRKLEEWLGYEGKE